MSKHVAVLGAVLFLVVAALFCTRAEAADSLQVTITVTIQQSLSIAWGAGTSTDDQGIQHPAGDTSAFNWTATSAVNGTNLKLNETVISSDTTNNKTIKVSCISQTGSTAAISGSVGEPAGWSVGTPGSDTFGIAATLGATSQPLSSAGGVSLGTVAAGTANDQPLSLALTTPTALTMLAGTEQVISVALTATVAP